MKRCLIGFLILTAAAFAEPAVPAKDYHWPSTTVLVRFGAVVIECVWSNNRPMASRQDLAKFLHISEAGADPADLIDAVTEKGWLVRQGHDGAIEIINPVSAADRPLIIRESAESRRALARFSSLVAQKNLIWLKDEPRAAMVTAMGQDLARVARRPIPWTFAIIRSSELNAACCGEGIVYITTALLDMLNRDELAGVLAHEVAHGAHQHLEENRNENGRRSRTRVDIDHIKRSYQEAQEQARRRYYADLEAGVDSSAAAATREQSVNSARQVYERSMHYLEDTISGHVSYGVFNAKSAERQADVIGMKYAVAAGYSADGILHALEKLLASNRSRHGEAALLGGETHPPMPDRIRALKEILHL